MKTRSYSQPDLAKLAVKMIIINELSALTDSTKKISGKSRYTYEVVISATEMLLFKLKI